MSSEGSLCIFGVVGFVRVHDSSGPMSSATAPHGMAEMGSNDVVGVKVGEQATVCWD